MERCPDRRRWDTTKIQFGKRPVTQQADDKHKPSPQPMMTVVWCISRGVGEVGWGVRGAVTIKKSGWSPLCSRDFNKILNPRQNESVVVRVGPPAHIAHHQHLPDDVHICVKCNNIWGYVRHTWVGQVIRTAYQRTRRKYQSHLRYGDPVNSS